MTHIDRILKYYENDKKIVKKYLIALREVLENYKEKRYGTGLCPLCRVERGCDDCPWYVVGNGYCVTMYSTAKEGRVPARKAQLKRWIKSYETALRIMKQK